jgi:hypothetical protein
MRKQRYYTYFFLTTLTNFHLLYIKQANIARKLEANSTILAATEKGPTVSKTVGPHWLSIKIWLRPNHTSGVCSEVFQTVVQDLDDIFAVVGKSAVVLHDVVVVVGCLEQTRRKGIAPVATAHLVGIDHAVAVGVDEDVRITTATSACPESRPRRGPPPGDTLRAHLLTRLRLP